MYRNIYLGNYAVWPFRTKPAESLTPIRLQSEAMRLGIEVHRRVFGHIKDAFRLYPQATAIFNCTGIGALTLGGVEDDKIFSARVRYSLMPRMNDHL